MGAVTGGARREGIGVAVELSRSESSFLAGDRSGDHAQNGVEVLASAEVTRQSPPDRGADAVLDTMCCAEWVWRSASWAVATVDRMGSSQGRRESRDWRESVLGVLAVAATSRSTTQRTTWRPRGAPERGEKLQQPVQQRAPDLGTLGRTQADKAERSPAQRHIDERRRTPRM